MEQTEQKRWRPSRPAGGIGHETLVRLRPELSLRRRPPWARATSGVVGTAALALHAMLPPARNPRLRLFRSALGLAGLLSIVEAALGQPLLRPVLVALAPVIVLRSRVRVNAPAPVAFSFWRDFSNYPRFMSFVEDVSVNARGGLHWRVRGPSSTRLSWDSWLTTLSTDQRIAWCSDEGAVLWHEGSVTIREIDDRACELEVEIAWAPPAGLLGSAVSRLLGFDPRATFDGDLARMRALVEAQADRFESLP